MSRRRKYEFTISAESEALDRYGNKTSPAQTRTVNRCTDWPNATGERVRGAVQTTEQRTLSLPPGELPIPSSWTVVYPDGGRWRIVGEPYSYREGVVCTIERRR